MKHSCNKIKPPPRPHAKAAEGVGPQGTRAQADIKTGPNPAYGFGPVGNMFFNLQSYSIGTIESSYSVRFASLYISRISILTTICIRDSISRYSYLSSTCMVITTCSRRRPVKITTKFIKLIIIIYQCSFKFSDTWHIPTFSSIISHCSKKAFFFFVTIICRSISITFIFTKAVMKGGWRFLCIKQQHLI